MLQWWKFIEDNGLVCLNNGRGTRVNINSLDLTVVSGTIAAKCQWEVLDQSTIGSDHYPILCKAGFEIQKNEISVQQKWKFNKADWEKFNNLCKNEMKGFNMKNYIDEYSDHLSSILLRAAEQSIPRINGNRRGKIVPWWNEECSNSIRKRNKAFRIIRKTLTPEAVIRCQKERAQARRIIKQTKKKKILVRVLFQLKKGNTIG